MILSLKSILYFKIEYVMNFVSSDKGKLWHLKFLFLFKILIIFKLQ